MFLADHVFLPAISFVDNPAKAAEYISSRADDVLKFMREGIASHPYARVERVNGEWVIRERGGKMTPCAFPSCGIAYVLARYW
jgi:hypothetical protein